MKGQLALFERCDTITAPDAPGCSRYAGVVFTAIGGEHAGQLRAYPLSSTLQGCDCGGCTPCEVARHCRRDRCGFDDVLPETARKVLAYIRDQQAGHNQEPDARLAWRLIHIGPWEDPPPDTDSSSVEDTEHEQHCTSRLRRGVKCAR